MAVKKKYKKLTNAEKKLNKEVKERMIKEGRIPPRKKPLNRRKFAQEVSKQLRDNYIGCESLCIGIGCLRPSGDLNIKITDEQVGVLKAVKIAIEFEKYYKDIKNEDEKAVITNGMIYDNVIKPIIDL